MITKSKSCSRYKGLRKPRCNGGSGCKLCWAKYDFVQHLNRVSKVVSKWPEWKRTLLG